MREAKSMKHFKSIMQFFILLSSCFPKHDQIGVKSLTRLRLNFHVVSKHDKRGAKLLTRLPLNFHVVFKT